MKAAREEKRETSWRDPDEAYESGIGEWVRAVLGDGEPRRRPRGLRRGVWPRRGGSAL
ncbi:MAG: hypothetical protein U5R31_11240 [Acidimicrobiia bacterium]|nr:hypothetical protein [Acidimicrobiia bacterium]